MSEDNRIDRVYMLLQHQKYAEAERILADLLNEDPLNVHHLSILAEIKLQLNEYAKARTFVDTAIGLAPDHPRLYYLKARIALHEDAISEAEELVQHAIELDPVDADYFAMLANIYLAKKDFELTLKNANIALGIDAENLLALNLRSTALNKLGRKEESYETINEALREDPNNAFTHANYGWGLLEKGDHKKALEHFKQALTIDPTFEYAQAGMLEALKARNPIYRGFLKYSFFMGNLTAKYQWGVIIGFYLGFRGIRILAERNEAWQPFLNPLIIALSILAFSTWVMKPIGNLFLRFNIYGQLLLSKKEKMSSNFVAISFAVFVAGLLLYFVTGYDMYLALLFFGFAMMLPLSVMFSETKPQHALLLYTVVLGAVGIGALLTIFSTGNITGGLSTLFLLGFIGFQWVANFLVIKESNY